MTKQEVLELKPGDLVKFESEYYLEYLLILYPILKLSPFKVFEIIKIYKTNNSIQSSNRIRYACADNTEKHLTKL